MGSRNHILVPTPLITQIAGLRSAGSVHTSISTLAKAGLIAKMKNAKYDGYRLTYGGLDYLALHAMRQGRRVYSLGNQIGVGKESDIYVVANEQGRTCVLKIHRLGRISFRTVKANRDYLRNRSSGSWMYMSRLAATKEFAFMRALRDNGFRVPEPVAQNRHTVLMEFIDAFPLRQISDVPDPAGMYGELMEMILSLARVGLIHGDFNEFNILIKEEQKPESLGQAQKSEITELAGHSGSGEKDAGQTNEKATTEWDKEDDGNSTGPAADAQVRLSGSNIHHRTPDEYESTSSDSKTTRLIPVLIDFPQMLSIDHANAAFYFDRDVACIKRFFSRRFGFTSDEPGPFLVDAIKDVGKGGAKRLDVEVEATGFSKKMAKELDTYMRDVGAMGDGDAVEGENGESTEDSAQQISEANDTLVGMDGSKASSVFEPLHDAPVDELADLELKENEQNKLKDWSRPVKPATDIHATKKAAGWAI